MRLGSQLIKTCDLKSLVVGVVNIVVQVLIVYLWIVEEGVGRLKAEGILLKYKIRSRFRR